MLEAEEGNDYKKLLPSSNNCKIQSNAYPAVQTSSVFNQSTQLTKSLCSLELRFKMSNVYVPYQYYVFSINTMGIYGDWAGSTQLNVLIAKACCPLSTNSETLKEVKPHPGAILIENCLWIFSLNSYLRNARDMNLPVLFCDSHFISADVRRNVTCNIDVFERYKNVKFAKRFQRIGAFAGNIMAQEITFSIVSLFWCLFVYCWCIG